MAVGSTARLFESQQIHFLRETVTFEDNGNAVTVGVIPAGSVILPTISGVSVRTAFDDSGTDLIDVGTSSDGDAYATNLAGQTVAFAALDELSSGYVDSDTTITATYAGQNSDATAGVAVVLIAYVPDL